MAYFQRRLHSPLMGPLARMYTYTWPMYLEWNEKTLLKEFLPMGTRVAFLLRLLKIDASLFFIYGNGCYL